MSKMQFVFKEFVDQTVVLDAILDPEGFIVDVVNEFNELETFEMNVADLSPTDLAYFLATLDNATFLFQEDALIWNIELKGKEFYLDNSYVRDAVSTETPLTELAVDTPIIVRFDIPGFETNSYRDLTLRYDSDFDPDELELLEEIGIEVTGNGKIFSITNVVECKASFYKPELVEEKYIINYDGLNVIII